MSSRLHGLDSQATHAARHGPLDFIALAITQQRRSKRRKHGDAARSHIRVRKD